MDTNELSITEARERLTQLPDELATSHEAVTITRHHQPVLAVLPWDLYEAMLETLEVMSEPATMAALRQSIEDVAAGRTISLEELRSELLAPDSSGGAAR